MVATLDVVSDGTAVGTSLCSVDADVADRDLLGLHRGCWCAAPARHREATGSIGGIVRATVVGDVAFRIDAAVGRALDVRWCEQPPSEESVDVIVDLHYEHLLAWLHDEATTLGHLVVAGVPLDADLFALACTEGLIASAVVHPLSAEERTLLVGAGRERALDERSVRRDDRRRAVRLDRTPDDGGPP